MLPGSELKTTANRCVSAITSAFEAAATGDRAGAARALSPIAGEIWPGMPAWKKPQVARQAAAPSSDVAGRRFTQQTSAVVFVRDRFQCRYCGQKLFSVPMLSALSAAFPEELPYTSTYNRGMMHPAFWLVGAEADHLVPGSLGGDWTDRENQVAACVLCNTRKANFLVDDLGIEPLASSLEDWDGRIRLYDEVWRFAGEPNPRYHSSWIRAFAYALGRISTA